MIVISVITTPAYVTFTYSQQHLRLSGIINPGKVEILPVRCWASLAPHRIQAYSQSGGHGDDDFGEGQSPGTRLRMLV
ncbi:MAG: hypothetical protein WD625_02140 [Balneolales bacterium]